MGHISIFANFEAERAQNGPKIFFSNVNQNKQYFPIMVSDQQVVKIVSPYCTLISGGGGEGAVIILSDQAMTTLLPPIPAILPSQEWGGGVPV